MVSKMTSENFHKIGVNGMDKFVDPVSASLEASTPIFSPHQEIDMIDNISIQTCIGCDNMTCTCDPVDEQTTTIFSPHQGNEMNLNKVLKPSNGMIQSTASEQCDTETESQLIDRIQHVSDDKSVLTADYVCEIDGMTTQIPLDKFTKGMKVVCADCGSDKVKRLHSSDFTEHDFDEPMETVENRKPQWKPHFIKGCRKCNGMLEDRSDSKAKQCHCENPEVATIEKFFKDTSETAGSHDPFTVMGLTKTAQVEQALKRKVWDRQSGEMISTFDKMIKDIHTRRMLEDNVFAKDEILARRIQAEYDFPLELIHPDIELPKFGNKNDEKQRSSEGQHTRVCKLRLLVPETAQESEAIAERHTTRDNIIENMNKKIARIQKGNDFDGTDQITPLQINTCNKYLGVKPNPKNIDFERLSRAMKDMQWASTQESKDAIKKMATKDIDRKTTFLVAMPERVKAFTKSVKVILASAQAPVIASGTPSAYNDVNMTSIDKNGLKHTRVQRFYDISVTTKEDLVKTAQMKQLRGMFGKFGIDNPNRVNTAKTNPLTPEMKGIVDMEYNNDFKSKQPEVTTASVSVSVNGTKPTVEITPKYVAKNIDIYDYEPITVSCEKCESSQIEAWKNTSENVPRNNKQILNNYLKSRLNPMTSISGEKINLIISAITNKSNDNSSVVAKEATPSPLSL